MRQQEPLVPIIGKNRGYLVLLDPLTVIAESTNTQTCKGQVLQYNHYSALFIIVLSMQLHLNRSSIIKSQPVFTAIHGEKATPGIATDVMCGMHPVSMESWLSHYDCRRRSMGHLWGCSTVSIR